MLKLPLTEQGDPVIADPYVDKEFGTGCVKITPAHDPNDFEVGKRHNLEEIVILNDDATVNVPGPYFGMDRYEPGRPLWLIWRHRACWSRWFPTPTMWEPMTAARPRWNPW